MKRLPGFGIVVRVPDGDKSLLLRQALNAWLKEIDLVVSQTFFKTMEFVWDILLEGVIIPLSIIPTV